MPTITYLGERYEARDGETVLEALLRQGARMPFSCRKGSCHTCILKCDAGEVEHSRAIDPELVHEHHILPCVAHARGDLALDLPDPSRLSVPAELVSRRDLGGGVFEIGIAPMKELDYRAGQHAQLIRADGLARPYSLTSQPGLDYFFTTHVRLHPDGAMSRWLCVDAPIGQSLSVLPPRGDCHWSPALMDSPRLLLLATGSGAGALAGIARQALAEGYAGDIRLYHGGRERSWLYLHDELRALAVQHPNFHYIACLSGETAPDMHAGHVTQVAFDELSDLADADVFLCGNPAMVDDARYRAILAGATAARIHADPFDAAEPTLPRDTEKVAALTADPELWAALDRGPKLRAILQSFYGRVYRDERLLPYFQGIPMSRVIDKQYEFLAMVWSGETDYLGLNPFNSHHWMVISDDLFDHREALFAEAMAEHALPAWAMRRIQALHELFRSDIVKPLARGMVVNGVEQPLHTHQVERLDIDAVCDGCGDEIPAGMPSRYHHRVGTLHCAECAALAM